jgi:CIC family chloride channel protein
MLAFFKIITTSFTIGSGGSAGVFGPTIFIGAMLGGGVGAFFHMFFPDVVVQPEAFILVGMSSFFAGVANAPLASLIMVCEMTGGYGLIAPLMIVSAFNILFLKKFSIYEKQVKNKFFSPAHLGNMRVNVLKEHMVSSIVKKEHVISVNPEMNLRFLNKIIEESSQMSFPVVQKGDNKYVGIVSIDNVREIMFKRHTEDLLIVEDVMMPPEKIEENIDLHQALGVFLKSGYNEVPVVDSDDTIIGMLSHSDIISAYDKTVDDITNGKT